MRNRGIVLLHGRTERGSLIDNPSQAVWPDGQIMFSILAIYSNENFAELHNPLAQVGSKLCPKQNKSVLNWPSLLKFRQRG